ncbi:DUF4179 domain-containing protein [Brevibacillus borstelensis]|uniref:DUF4179 domain-containing protein n=1 Tax=Brevibacillus borstelensis TaxID=45462 RepID=UPI0014905469|nr:DUF4179 domain-containing protein [Brevibacillus borstelensis]MCC0565153.1 DUF4179 domain-containing protein [Brevibacillus borstelensis]MCM3560009.1 DUF4179 domain-containing protein [Brevibacillus borstelensis]MCM3591660.1 DUF4179 domain-containing protein [Brevibacillus borstelensis]NOU53763.1 DUF4179 domain-containing protein [Brevibacillus borstelensis]
MTCLDKDMLDAYLEDSLSLRDRQNVQNHLLTCSACQRLFEQYLDESDTLGEQEKWHTDAVIQQVMEKVPPHPLNVLRRIDRHRAQKIDWKKRSVALMKKTTMAVAGLAVVVALGTLVSPTFASYVNGLFYAANPLKGPYTDTESVVSLYSEEQTDKGALVAAEKGYVKPLNLKVTDQGLTMEMKAVLADSARIMVLGSLTDKEGKKLDTFWQDQFSRISSENVEEYRVIQLKDKNGRVLNPPNSKLPDSFRWMPLPNGENFVIGRDFAELFDDRSRLPDEAILEVRVKQLGETKGSWNFDIPIDLRPAKAATKTVSVQQKLTTPQGEWIDLKEARFSPSAAQLQFAVSEGTGRDKGVRYSLIDEQGTVLASWDDLHVIYPGEELSSNVIPGLSRGGMYNAGRLPYKNVWVHSFAPIDHTKKVTMKLDAVYTAEKADFRAKLSIAELDKKPVTVTEEGNTFTFTPVKKQERGDDTIYIIDMEGTLAKDVVGVGKSWMATDEKGESNALLLSPQITIAEDGTRKLNAQIKIRTKNKDVKEFTITYDEKIKQHDVKWEVPIQVEQ